MNRLEASKRLGRRISQGEWQRRTVDYVEHVSRRTGGVTVTIKPGTPKWYRKCIWSYLLGARARYDRDGNYV